MIFIYKSRNALTISKDAKDVNIQFFYIKPAQKGIQDGACGPPRVMSSHNSTHLARCVPPGLVYMKKQDLYLNVMSQ